MFPVPPDVLDRVEFGSVGREPFEFDAVAVGSDEVSDEHAAVGAQPVPDDEELSREMAHEMLQELDDALLIDCAVMELEVEIPPGNARDHRESIPVEVELEDRSLAARCPGAAAMWPFAQPALVDEDDRPAFSRGVFFTLGHSTFFQCAIAFSSRSRAFPVGRWQLQPRRRRIRHT